MQITGTGPFLGLLAVLSSLLGLVTTVFWIIVGWRAMRAHEEIATLLREKREQP